jgi:hypothetical protein
MIAPVLCPKCSVPVPAAYFNAPVFGSCPACGVQLRVRLFPALLRPVTAGSVGDRITDAGQAACFYHPHKTAHVPCDACGRFICALCDVELQGQHLCPSCVESGRRKGTLTTFENKRMLWDSIAITTAVLPLLVLWFASFITAPAAIIVAIIGWRKPRSLAPRRAKPRFIFAIVFSVLVLVGWGVGIWYLVTQANTFE